MDYEMENEGAEESAVQPSEEGEGRVAEIGRDLARLAKNISDPSIRAQLETYSEELTELAGEESPEEAPAMAPAKKSVSGTSDKLAVAQLRKSVKV